MAIDSSICLRGMKTNMRLKYATFPSVASPDSLKRHTNCGRNFFAAHGCRLTGCYVSIMPMHFLLLVVTMFALGQSAVTFAKPAVSNVDIIAAVQSIIEKDPNAALITTGKDGQPRARTVLVRPPVDDLVIWISTTPTSRKVEQIRENSRVALYFSVDDEFSYATIMGIATFYDDPETKELIKWRNEEHRQRLWPDFPEGYLLIRVQPTRVEVLGEGIWWIDDTWRPAALDLGGGK